MTKKELKEFVKADIFRNAGEYNKKLLFKSVFHMKGTMSLLYYFRWCNYYCQLERRNIFQKLHHSLCYLSFRKLQNQCGVEMNQRMKIGYGLRLPHSGAIILHPQTVIGNNCEIMQGVTIGNNIMKSRDAVPVIGNEVLICAGATVVGDVRIGDTVVIGANSFVNKDVSSGTIVGGVPAKNIGPCDDRFVINRYEAIS